MDPSMKRSHSSLHGLVGLAGNPHRDVVVCESLDESKDHRFFSVLLTNNRIHSPVSGFIPVPLAANVALACVLALPCY